ncbi:S8/S53 family peptidase [Chryseobacterium sp.]|uniref:S8/S53 family peptidase n=1 Tax=Chryseobacterium sp. TaxID=1871047 RepID=UPI0031E438DD
MYSCIIYTKTPEKLKAEGILLQSQLSNFATALVSIDDIERLLQLPYVISIEGPAFSKNTNDVSRAQSGASLLQDGVLNNTSYTGSGVLIGVYDSGIDWKHPDFRKANDQTKSRIYSIWDQSLTAQGSEAPPSGFSTGVEYTRAQIEDELDGTPANFVREKDIDGHGTHVAGTAAGTGAALPDKKHRGFAPDADLVIVKGGDGNYSDTNIINGLTYFQNVATALNKPIVVNMSIGSDFYAHDGAAPNDVAVDSFTSSGPGRVAVISAGNGYGNNMHTKADIASGAAGYYTFTVGSDTSSQSIFKFIMYANDGTSVTAKLTTPDGQQYIQNVSTDTTHSILGGGFTAYMENYTNAVSNKRYVWLMVDRVAGSTADCQGTYTLEITNNGSQAISAHAWLYQKGLATLEGGDNDYIVGTPGTATSAITVGAYTGRATWYTPSDNDWYAVIGSREESIYSQSSKGPRVDGLLKPEITASGEKVISSRSGDKPIPSGTTNTYDIIDDHYYVADGTSMATPGVAGSVALLLQANPNLTAAEVKSRLILNARKDEATGTVPNSRWGYGKLDAYKTVSGEVNCLKSDFETIGYDLPFVQGSSSQQFYYYDNMMLAVRYTPTLTGKLGGVSFTTGYAIPASDISVDIQIRKIDANGNPGEIIASKTVPSWLNNTRRSTGNYISLSDLNVQVVTGEDFYIVINGSAGRISMMSESSIVDGRSKTSSDGVNWYLRNFDLRIRATVYENVPEVKKLALTNLTKASTATNGYNYFADNCELIARVKKETSSSVAGSVTSKVWVDNAQPSYVSRRYEINPDNNATTATGKVTLYFKQEEFDAYNLTSAVKLPTSSADSANKANLVIEKYTGISTGNTGTVASYGSPVSVITPNVADIVWNEMYQYWEVSFLTIGFGGYFVKANPSVLGVNDVKGDSEVNIYPNPAKTVVNINLGKASKAVITIYDMSGKLVKTVNVNSKVNKIDISDLAKGTYMFKIVMNNIIKNTKVIKE